MTIEPPSPIGAIHYQKSAASEGWVVLGVTAAVIAVFGVFQWFLFPPIWAGFKLAVVFLLTVEAGIAGVAICYALSNLRSGRVFECRIDEKAIVCICPTKLAGESFSILLPDVAKIERENYGDGDYRWYVWDRCGKRHWLTTNYGNPVDAIIAALCYRLPGVERVGLQEPDANGDPWALSADAGTESSVDNSRSHGETPSFLRRVLPNILAFALGLGVAYFLKWETTDLVWSLWLCSLVLGYLTILSILAAGAYVGLYVIRDKGLEKKQRTTVILVGLVAGLFFLGFFSLHFCGFHAGHSVFLNSFFPVAGMPQDAFGRAFMNPPLLWMMVFKYLIIPYGVFLIPAIIAERKHVFRPLIEVVRAVRSGENPKDLNPGGHAEDGKEKHPLGDAMARPYVNVVRMHLLIFFFGLCHAVKVDSFFVYAVVYSVYFFPWNDVKDLRTLPHGKRRREDGGHHP